MTAIELVAFRQPSILAQEIGKRAAIEPLAVQPPFAARSQQLIGRQHEQHPVPARPFAAHTQPVRPEPVETQLAPQFERQPAGTQLPRPPSRTCDSFSWTIEPSGTSPSQRSSGNSDSVRGCVVPASITSIERRHASSWLELISPRY